MRTWRASAHPLNPMSHMLPLMVAKMQEDPLFSAPFESQRESNGSPGEDEQVALTVGELRSLCAYWAGLGRGIARMSGGPLHFLATAMDAVHKAEQEEKKDFNKTP